MAIKTAAQAKSEATTNSTKRLNDLEARFEKERDALVANHGALSMEFIVDNAPQAFLDVLTAAKYTVAVRPGFLLISWGN